MQIRMGDTHPVFTATLSYVRNRATTGYDLTDCTMTLRWRLAGTTGDYEERAMVIVNAATGKVSYTFAVDDFDAPGRYLAHVRFVRGDDSGTFPGKGYAEILVTPPL